MPARSSAHPNPVKTTANHIADLPPHAGLTRPEAAKRLKQYGPNTLNLEPKTPAFFVFLATFKSPLIIILLLASAISYLFGDHLSAILIVSMVSLSSILDFTNTYRSDRAAQELKDRVKVKAQVIRDRQIVEIPLDNLVPGDLIQLSVGNIIPADCRVLSATHLFLNESSLNGESFPVGKTTNDEIYMGSSVTSGQGFAEVVTTGAQTKFSHIAAALSRTQAPTEFDREMKSFSYLIIKITFALVIFVFFVNALLKGDLLQSLMFAVALAVGLTPEMLPMIITLNLTRGSLTMAKHGVIVKRLSSIQNFGSMDVLATDKTGTLTEDKIALVKYVDGFGQPSECVFKYAYLNSAFSGGFHSPLDDAIQDYKHQSLTGYHKLDEFPFDFARRRESIILKTGETHLLISKGATEELLAICSHYGEQKHKLNPGTVQLIHQQYQNLSQEGFRLLAVAIKHLPIAPHYQPSQEQDMTFLGFIAFLDPPKKTVIPTLKKMKNLGVNIKIITGDNELVTQKIASEINFPITGLLLGPQLDKLSDYQLSLRAETANVFARVTPEQKMRIIKILQANRHVVGYIGDGINDAPSLKAADVGISVNNAVDIAKDSADLILLHKSLDDLNQGVLEGRKTYANTMKYLRMSLSSNLGNVFSMAGASIFLPFLPMLPTQILFNNLLYDTSQFAIPLDAVDQNDLTAPQKLSMHAFKKFMYIFGPLSSIFDFITFYTLFHLYHLRGSSFQTGWFIESLATQIFVVYIIRTKKVPFLHSWPSPILLISTILTVTLGTIITFSQLGSYLSFTPLPINILSAITLIVLAYLFIIELAKRLYNRYLV